MIPTRRRERRAEVFRRYPVTLLLAIQYVPLVLVPAVNNGNLGPAIFGITGMGLLAAFGVETLMVRIPVTTATRFTYSMRGVRLVTYTGLAATVISGLAGARTYATQAAGREGSSIVAAVTTPLVPWALIGCVLALLAVPAGQASRAEAIRLVGITTAITAFVAILGGIVAPAATFVMPVAAIALILRFIRVRTVVLLMLVAVLAWPLVFAFRNQVRSESGTTAAQITTTAQERLNLDGQMVLLDEYGRQHVDDPGFPNMVRYGLIPRVLDRGRPALTTGIDINAAYGGSGRSSLSLTVLGNVFLFRGWLGVITYAGLLAVGFRLLLRSSRPLVIVAVGLGVQTLLWIDSIFPLSIAGFLQSLVSLAAAAPALRYGTRWLGYRRGAVRWGPWVLLKAVAPPVPVTSRALP